MEKTIDGIRYTITPTPPSLSPYTMLLGKLLNIEPSNVEEAEKTSVEIDKAMTKLFEGTVLPQPKREHHIQLYNAVIEVTNKALKDAGFFRKHGKSNVDKSGTISTSTP